MPLFVVQALAVTRGANMTFKQVAGFTFTELLAALAINSFILAALISVFLGNINHSRISVNTNRLNQQMQSTLSIMVSDIRRAGYWANAKDDVGISQNNNPFQATGVDIAVNGAGNCILFAYDKDSNGALPAVSNTYDDERYGYRLSGGAVQARPPGATFACTAAATNWENMTDPSFITITNLQFVITTRTMTTGPGTKAVILRSLDITLTGQLVSNPAITRTLTQHVRIRNGKFNP